MLILKIIFDIYANLFAGEAGAARQYSFSALQLYLRQATSGTFALAYHKLVVCTFKIKLAVF